MNTLTTSILYWIMQALTTSSTTKQERMTVIDELIEELNAVRQSLDAEIMIERLRYTP